MSNPSWLTSLMTLMATLAFGCSGLPGDEVSREDNRRGIPAPDSIVSQRGDTGGAAEEQEAGGVTDPFDPLAAQAIALLDQHCLSCHAGVAGATNWGMAAGADWKLWRDQTPAGLIVPGSPDSSRLIVRMLHSAAGGNMPPGANDETFPKENFDLIYHWVETMAEPEAGDGDTDSGTTGGDPRPLALDYLDQHCLTCHNGAGAPTNWGVVAGDSELDWQSKTQSGLIVAGDAENSRLVRYMIHATNGTMPPGATADTFPEDVFATIVAWIDGLTPLDDGGEEEVVLAAGDGIYLKTERLRLGDRNFVADTLTHVFGASPQAEKIRGLLLPFGGPCPELRGWSEGGTGAECMNLSETMNFATGTTSFANYGGYTNMLAYKHVDQIDLKTSGAPVVPGSTVVREGNRTLACEELLLDQSYNGGDPTVALLHALQAVANTSAALDGTSPSTLDFNNYPAADSSPSDLELSIAHMLFYNYQPPSDAQLAALRALAERATQPDITAVGDWPKRFEPWRYVFLTLCLTPGWQVP